MIGIGRGLSALVAVAAAGPGSQIGRRAAQILARHELAKLAKEPWWYRVLVNIERLIGAGSRAIPPGWFGLIVFGVLVLVLVVVIFSRVRPRVTGKTHAGTVLGGHARTAREYRLDAERLAGQGDYSAAIVEGVRAIAAELDERGIVPPRAGRTADELAFEAGRELPAFASDLLTVTRLFDDIRYGGRSGTKSGYDLVGLADNEVRKARSAAARPDRAQASQLGVPR